MCHCRIIVFLAVLGSANAILTQSSSARGSILCQEVKSEHLTAKEQELRSILCKYSKLQRVLKKAEETAMEDDLAKLSDLDAHFSKTSVQSNWDAQKKKKWTTETRPAVIKLKERLVEELNRRETYVIDKKMFEEKEGKDFSRALDFLQQLGCSKRAFKRTEFESEAMPDVKVRCGAENPEAVINKMWNKATASGIVVEFEAFERALKWLEEHLDDDEINSLGFEDPITLEIMRDPVKNQYNTVYDRLSAQSMTIGMRDATGQQITKYVEEESTETRFNMISRWQKRKQLTPSVEGNLEMESETSV